MIDQKRPETGTMRFQDDWTGLFVRGDNAMYYAYKLRTALELLERDAPARDYDAFLKMELEGLIRLFSSCMHGPGVEPEAQLMKEFTRWVREAAPGTLTDPT